MRRIHRSNFGSTRRYHKFFFLQACHRQDSREILKTWYCDGKCCTQRCRAFQTQEDPFQVAIEHMNTNYLQNVYLAKYALPHLQQSKGIIAPFSSVLGEMGSWASASLAASKHAIHGFYKSLGLELEDSVSITIISVPFVRTQTALQSLNQNLTPLGWPLSTVPSKLIPNRSFFNHVSLETLWEVFWTTFYHIWLAKSQSPSFFPILMCRRNCKDWKTVVFPKRAAQRAVRSIQKTNIVRFL